MSKGAHYGREKGRVDRSMRLAPRLDDVVPIAVKLVPLDLEGTKVFAETFLRVG